MDATALSAPPQPDTHTHLLNAPFAHLALAALGIIYGDIGTSPLYTIKECFSGTHGMATTPANILGILSMVFWSLIFVVSLKYVLFVLRADNKGEGDTFSLLAVLRIHLNWYLVILPGLLLNYFGQGILFSATPGTPLHFSRFHRIG